jgi:hypothetical protein
MKITRFVENILEHHFELVKPLIPKYKSKPTKKTMLDHNYHSIRARAAQYKIIQTIIPRSGQRSQTNRLQPQTVISKVMSLPIRALATDEYWMEIVRFDKLKQKKEASCIPTISDAMGLVNEKGAVSELIEKYCKKIQSKFRAEPSAWPELCPIEMVVFLYMFSIVQDGNASVIGWYELVRIMRDASVYFGDQNDDDDLTRVHVGCLCGVELSKPKTGKMRGPLTTHFSHIAGVVDNIGVMCAQLQDSNGFDIYTTEIHLHRTIKMDVPGCHGIRITIPSVFMTANNETSAVFIYFIPDLNELNWNEWYMTTIAHDYLIELDWILTSDGEDKRDNKDRFGLGKTRLFVMFSLYDHPRVITHTPDSYLPTMNAILTQMVRKKGLGYNKTVIDNLAKYAHAHGGYKHAIVELERVNDLVKETKPEELTTLIVSNPIFDGLEKQLSSYVEKWLNRFTGKIEDDEWSESDMKEKFESGSENRKLDRELEKALQKESYYHAL